jgi:hypothetical protein
MAEHEYIEKVETEHTGGGVMVDYVHLKSGQVLGVSDECVVLYEDEDAVHEGERSGQKIELE